MTTKKGPDFSGPFLLNLALSTFPGRLQPSIIDAVDLTSVFGMGTGISPLLYAPKIFQNFYKVTMKVCKQSKSTYNFASGILVSNSKSVTKTFDLLVLVSLTHYCAYTPSLSTS
jgi:hypothetical protein